MKTQIVAAVMGLLMLSLTTIACGTIAGGAIGAGTGAAIGGGTGYCAKKSAPVCGGGGAAAGAGFRHCPLATKLEVFPLSSDGGLGIIAVTITQISRMPSPPGDWRNSGAHT